MCIYIYTHVFNIFQKDIEQSISNKMVASGMWVQDHGRIETSHHKLF